MLIIAEKPSVARNISYFLSNGNYRRIKFSNGIYYYFLKLDGENIFVVPSIGHLYTISDMKRDFSYPTFNYKWVPSYYEDRIFIKKKYIEMFRQFSNEDKVVLATDYDIEGELIGYNIIRFALNRRDANRMIFSAITKKDILNSFYNQRDNIDYGMAIAGEVRHIVDWLYGINLSRILTRSLWHYTKDYILSIGRVQGPTLKIILEREKEIENYKPEEYYVLSAVILKDNLKIKAVYREKLKSRSEAEDIKKRIGKSVKVIDVKVEKLSEAPPHPYNLTNIQVDAYKLYKISPKSTLDILQSLYERGYVSYPRTSSEKLPDTIDFRSIIENLGEISAYRRFSEALISKRVLRPNNGKKEDVHPAIHPTGIIPSNLSKKEFLIYDLVVRRFFATFMDPAILERNIVLFSNGLEFDYKKCISKGWMVVYWNILSKVFLEINFKVGEVLNVEKVSINKKKTPPPPRYNQASLIKKMEEYNLGTKSTRAEVISILYNRNYIDGRSIRLTKLGEKVIDIFERYFPEILDINLTRKIEDKLELIMKNPDSSIKDEVIGEVIEIIKQISNGLDEKKIGKEIYDAIKLLNSNNT
ncbi:DNA topoisomerase I [Nanoarchaeota archaeon NZ13-N]|nr:MAG: DNA topoisomerase I [Nanoarchaeota archaeon NZ13-N]